MIVTLTLNPGLDLTYTLTESAVGQVDVHRATAATMEASGKGVNVSRALHANGIDTVAVLPLGGPTGRHLSELLEADGVPYRGVAQASATRINTTIVLDGGPTAKVNGPGGPLTGDDLSALAAEVGAALTAAAGDEVWLALCGSLPPGVDPAVVGEFVALAHAHGARCVVDASGEALAVAVRSGADLLAPNRLELSEVDPRAASADSLEALADVAVAVAVAVARDGAALLVSLGEDGALYTDGDVVLHGHGPRLTPVNTAGAGDALLAGWLAASGPPAERMARAVRWGRAACLSPTTVAPAVPTVTAPDDEVVVDTVRRTRLERSQP